MLQIPPPKVETAEFVEPVVVWQGSAADVPMANLSDGGEGLYNVYVKNSGLFYDFYCSIVITPQEDSKTFFVGAQSGAGVGVGFYGGSFEPESGSGTNTITKIVKIK